MLGERIIDELRIERAPRKAQRLPEPVQRGLAHQGTRAIVDHDVVVERRHDVGGADRPTRIGRNTGVVVLTGDEATCDGAAGGGAAGACVSPAGPIVSASTLLLEIAEAGGSSATGSGSLAFRNGFGARSSGGAARSKSRATRGSSGALGGWNSTTRGSPGDGCFKAHRKTGICHGKPHPRWSILLTIVQVE